MFSSLPLVAAVAAISYLCHFVHTRCFSSLGPNPIDNTVQVQSPNDEPTSPPPANKLVDPLPKPMLVVVLGWGGSTRKQLRRIIDFCSHTLGCSTVSYINPMTQFLEGSLHEPSIQQLLAQINEQMTSKNGPKQFVFLIHSNNGAFVYGELKSRMLEADGPYSHLRKHLRGVIFDSSPAVLDHPKPKGESSVLASVWQSLVSAFQFSFPCVAIVTQRPIYVHPFWTPAIAAWALAFGLVHALKKRLSATLADPKPANDTRTILYQQLKSNVPQVPHLFLYSAGDKLLASHRIESYISFLKTTYQLRIVTHDFKTTGHVQHFLKDPATYAQRLRAFLCDL